MRRRTFQALTVLRYAIAQSEFHAPGTDGRHHALGKEPAATSPPCRGPPSGSRCDQTPCSPAWQSAALGASSMHLLRPPCRGSCEASESPTPLLAASLQVKHRPFSDEMRLAVFYSARRRCIANVAMWLVTLRQRYTNPFRSTQSRLQNPESRLQAVAAVTRQCGSRGCGVCPTTVDRGSLPLNHCQGARISPRDDKYP